MSGIYSNELLQHAKHPKGAAKISREEADAEAHNPVCGDRIRVKLCWQVGERLAEMRHESRACALCTASASLAVERLENKKRTVVAAAVQAMLEELGTVAFPADDPMSMFNELAAYPSRIRCARLPWEALRKALVQGEQNR